MDYKQIQNVAFDAALDYCVANLADISICAGTHNENSSMHLVNLMAQHGLAANDRRIYFSQLLGMSDNLSYNLSMAGYNVAKYVPYGPVKKVLPYLFRRAEEKHRHCWTNGNRVEFDCGGAEAEKVILI